MAVAVAVFVLAGCGGSDDPDVLVERLPGADSEIAFVRGGDAIWIVAAEGVSRRLVADSASDPAWSPDGKRLAFARMEGAKHHLWVVNADGTGERQLTSGPDDERGPAWSPDGSRIVFVGKSGLFVMNADGSGVRPLIVNGLESLEAPDWSPDGRWIVFSAYDRAGSWGLWLLRPDGTRRRRLIGDSWFEPSWSPNGERIAVASLSTIGVGAAGGGGFVALYHHGDKQDSSPDWSPNGRWIVFARRIPGYKPFCCGIYGLWLVGADGGKPRQLTEGDDSQPSWRPAN